MIKSMTGFCKTEAQNEDFSCNIEIRSVNHRFLEGRVNLPGEFQYLSETLKKQLKKQLSRGKVDVSITIKNESQSDLKLILNKGVWDSVKQLKSEIEADLGCEMEMSMSNVLGIKDLVSYETTKLDTEKHEAFLKDALAEAIVELIKMRQYEGELLYKEIDGHLDNLQTNIDLIPQYMDEMAVKFKDRLIKNISKLNIDVSADDPRIIQEIGIFADKSDLSEEIERFNTHLIHFRKILNGEEAVGRKLDFLTQELNREANTICSKSNHTKVSQIGVELKSEIEKIREQIQNIE